MLPQFKVGVNAILIKDNKVLLGKRLGSSGVGQWGFPGGHLEYKELMIEGVKRELREETGLEATDLQFLQLVNDPTEHDHYIQVNFVVTNWTGTIEVKEPDRCEAWGWFDLDNLPENIFFGHAKFLPLYKEGKNFVG